MTAKLVWATPDGEKLLGYIARVSNPAATPDDDSKKLIAYLMKHKHWSPFEMVSVCIEIETPRTIARQLLRHRSFSFQEFSQRYAKVEQQPFYSTARMQHPTNRQLSVPADDETARYAWDFAQRAVWDFAYGAYTAAIRAGVAKELARNLLPEGLAPSRMYVSGSLRSWIHYLQVRLGNGTQPEHVALAEEVKAVLEKEFPTIMAMVEAHE